MLYDFVKHNMCAPLKIYAEYIVNFYSNVLKSLTLNKGLCRVQQIVRFNTNCYKVLTLEINVEYYKLFTLL